MTSYLLKLFICCYIFALAKHSEASEAKQLRKFISEYRSSGRSQTVSEISSTSSSFQSPGAIPIIIPQDGQMALDKITSLPGQPEGVDFDQYSGYITVDPKAGRALFYYFVESPQNSSSKPLVLWLNGGPGCSSLGFGAMEELGPFRVNSDGETLYRNYYAWNNVANVLFLESPAGVGFSYSNTTSDYDRAGDNTTADDSYTFLINWLERFPQYKTHEFFITGESYAGHYIPQLAEKILQSNKVTNQTVINLCGVAIGNGFVDTTFNAIGKLEYLWSHALYSDETYAAVRKECDFFSKNDSVACHNAIELAFNEIGDLDIDYYNIYAPQCHGSNGSTTSGVAMAIFDPCSDDYVHAYLNNPAVQKALHSSAPHEWRNCSRFHWRNSPETMLPTIKELIGSGISVWLYSGDIDSVCPITATRYFIKMLGLPRKSSWRPWALNNEIGGYVEEYEGLTLATVRGAGHMVPSDQPERALTLISSFLQGKLPPPLAS